MFRAGQEEAGRRWGFLSNHLLVLLCVAREPDLRVRDIAANVGITERSSLAILRDLRDDGYLEWIRVGRRSHYRVRRDAPLRDPMVADYPVSAVIDALGASTEGPRLVY